LKLCNELSDNYLEEKLQKNPNNINELGINLANLTLKNIELNDNESNTLHDAFRIFYNNALDVNN